MLLLKTKVALRKPSEGCELLLLFIVVSYVGNVQASDVVPADEVCLYSLSSCWSLPISASLVS